MPTILAIETSSERASCALLRDGRLSTRASEGVRTHSQAILPMVQELLADAGLALAGCDAIAYGAGPGSFTGVRTATGIAQGLGFGASLPVVAVVTLEAMAESCRIADGDVHEVLAVLDARMGEVYWARYQWRGAGWHAVDAPALAAPGAVPAPGQAVVCGNGVAAYADAFAAAWGPAALARAGLRAGVMPDAGAVALLGARAFAQGLGAAADQAQPLYLRNKIAFTSAERQAINAQKAAAA